MTFWKLACVWLSYCQCFDFISDVGTLFAGLSGTNALLVSQRAATYIENKEEYISESSADVLERCNATEIQGIIYLSIQYLFLASNTTDVLKSYPVCFSSCSLFFRHLTGSTL
jgi:hypothetical protein